MLLLTLCLVPIIIINQGHCGTVSPTNKTVTATIGNDVILNWEVTLNGDTDSLQLKVKNASSGILWSLGDGGNTDLATSLFGENRFGVVVTSAKPKIVTLTLKNASLSDSGMVFELAGLFLLGSTVTPFKKNEIKLIVEGGPISCGSALNTTYEFPDNITPPKIFLCAFGNPAPILTFNFGDDTPSSHTGSVLDKKTHKYQFEIDLPKLKASHCGKQLNYTIASNRQPTPPAIKGNFKVLVTDFPLDVVIRSFSYNADIKPVVQWIEVESGNCLVNYYVEVTSSTGAKVQRGPITGSSVIVDDFNNPKHVTVFAMNNGTFPKGYFVGNNSWQSGYQPKGSQSTPLEFTITTTTTTTQRPTTGKRITEAVQKDENPSSPIGLIIGAVVGGVLFIVVIIVIVVVLCKKRNKKDSIDHSTNVNVNQNAENRDKKDQHDGAEMSLQTWQKERTQENNYDSLSNGGAPPNNKEEDPGQAIYSELGPGGRVGPKPTPAQSNYAEVKMDDYGFPVTGAPKSPPEMTIYDQVKRDSDDFSDNGIIV